MSPGKNSNLSHVIDTVTTTKIQDQDMTDLTPQAHKVTKIVLIDPNPKIFSVLHILLHTFCVATSSQKPSVSQTSYLQILFTLIHF